MTLCYGYSTRSNALTPSSDSPLSALACAEALWHAPAGRSTEGRFRCRECVRASHTVGRVCITTPSPLPLQPTLPSPAHRIWRTYPCVGRALPCLAVCARLALPRLASPRLTSSTRACAWLPLSQDCFGCDGKQGALPTVRFGRCELCYYCRRADASCCTSYVVWQRRRGRCGVLAECSGVRFSWLSRASGVPIVADHGLAVYHPW